MKRLSLIFSLLAVLSAVLAQPTPQLLVRDTIVGTSSITGQPLVAQHFASPQKIAHWYWDGLSNNLLLELFVPNNDTKKIEHERLLAMFDLDNQHIKWSQLVNSNLTQVNLEGYHYFISDNKLTYRINPETGKRLWQNKNGFYFTHPQLNIGLGYPLKSFSNKLTAVDLTTGRNLWSTKVNRRDGWREVQMVNDSTVVILSDGITAINLVSAEVWRHKPKTRRTKTGKFLSRNLLAGLVAFFSGDDEIAAMIAQDELEVISEMISNTATDEEGNIFLAGRDKLVKLHEGKPVWQTALPKKKSSTSSIFLGDSLVYMINRGYGHYNDQFTTIGKPFVAGYDRELGRRRFLTYLEVDNDFVHTFQAVDDRLYAVVNNRLLAYSLADGVLLAEQVFNLPEGEVLDNFITGGYYRKAGNGLLRDIAAEHPQHHALTTSEGSLYVVTDDLEVMFFYDRKDMFRERISSEQFTLVDGERGQLVVLNHEGTQLAVVTRLADELFLHEGQLLFVGEEEVWVVDL